VIFCLGDSAYLPEILEIGEDKRVKKGFNILILVVILLWVVSCAREPEPAAEEVALVPEEEPTETAVPPTETAVPTETATPTMTFTPAPTVGAPATLTSVPTITPSPTPVGTDTPTPTATYTPTPLPTETPIPPPRVPLPELNLVPGSPQPYLSRFTLVTYYGTPNGPSLGILGAQPRFYTNISLRNLRTEFEPYVDPGRFVIPTYHMITTVADEWPGPDGNYNHWLDWGIITDWIAAAEEQGFAVIVDIQPGREDVMVEFERVWGLLYNPHVHLAVDPEFVMYPDEVPGQQIGQISAEQINALQARMNAIGFEIGLNRVLILHQFEDDMILNKDQIQNFPFVELVIDADGYGPAGTKIRDYNQYAAEPGFEYGGFKVFYDWDSPVMTPDQIMYQSPQPAVVIFQ